MLRPPRATASSTARSSLSEAQEDYLKQILLLGDERSLVSTQRLSQALGVRPASVTEMVGRLHDLGLVHRVPYRGVRLSQAGRLVALEMVRHHRLLETFLAEKLGYPWHQVHDEAERLEHVISERFEARIAESTGHPTHDPHGDPIPAADLSMPAEPACRMLTALRDGSGGVVVRVSSQDPDSLTTLSRMKLGLGALVHLEGRRGDIVTVRVDGERLMLPLSLAENMWIEEVRS